MGSTQAIKQAVRAGVGIALISRRAVEDECRAGLVACVKVKDLRVARSFHLVTHKDRTRWPLAQAFLVFLESQPIERPSEASCAGPRPRARRSFSPPTPPSLGW